MTCRFALSLGAYVLGALEPRERSEVERHLAGCAACRDELVRLAPLPGLMRRLSPDDIPALATGATERVALPGPVPATTARAPARSPGRARDRRGRLRFWAAVAAAALGGSVVGGGAYRGLVGGSAAPPQTAATVTWSGTDPTTQVRAAVAFVPRSWGTEVHLRLRGLPAGEHCRLVLRARDGRTEVDGAWSTTYAAAADVPAATAIRTPDIAAVDVVTADHRLLVRLPQWANAAVAHRSGVVPRVAVWKGVREG